MQGECTYILQQSEMSGNRSVPLVMDVSTMLNNKTAITKHCSRCGVRFGRFVNAHDRYIVSRVTRKSV